VQEPRGGLPKDVLVNFLGDLTSHRLRQEMAATLIAEPGFMIGKVCPNSNNVATREGAYRRLSTNGSALMATPGPG
jgi:hypothetical protein